MSDVFISYSRKDKAFVQRLHHALAAEGRDTWVDWEDIEYTEDWWAGIQAGIEEADTFIFVISPDSVASQVCHQEINHAAAHNKRLVPVVYREAPTDQVPDKLKHLNWLFFREDDDFDRVFQDLMRVMDTDLEWVKAHTRLTVRAVEWESHDRNDSFVLRGDDLKEAEQRLDQRDKEPQLTELQVQYIVASQRSAIRRRGRVLGGVAVGLIVAAVLAVIAFLMFQASQREAALRRTEANARQTAESIMTTAEAEADVAATRAGEAQAAAYVAETAEAEALGAQATAVAARQTAEAGREAAVVAEQTAQAARAVALTQQAQAEQNEAAAVAAQQTAQAAEQAASQAQQTAQAGQATAEAQQAEAEAAAREAEQARWEAEAAAQQARQAQAEAEAAAREAEQAKQEAEAAQAAAEATLVAVEALRDETEQQLREIQRAIFISKYAKNCEIGAGNPVALASDGASVWVAKENELIRLSAYDCQNLGSLSVAASDITYGGGYVWAVSGNQVHQISLASTSIINTFQAGSPESQATAVLHDGDSIWAASSANGQNIMHKIDPASGATSSYPVGDGSPVKELAYGGGYIWFSEEDWTTVVSRINAMNGTLGDDVSIGDEYRRRVLSITSGGGYIWVLSQSPPTIDGTFDRISKLNASSGALEGTFDYGLSVSLFHFVFDGNNIWVSGYDSITEIRADTGRMGTEVLTTIQDPRAMIFDGTYIWVLSGYVTRVPITIHLAGTEPRALAEDGAYIWVANLGGLPQDATVGKHLASTGEQVQLLKIDSSPMPRPNVRGFTCAHLNIWVALDRPDYRGFLLKLSTKDGRLDTFSLDWSHPLSIAYDDNRYIWVGTWDGVIRLRESDAEPAGTFLDGVYIGDILYDGSHIWVVGGDDIGRLIKLDPIDGSRLATYPLPPDLSPRPWSHQFVYDGDNHSFWVLGSGLILQVSAEDGTIITPAIPVPSSNFSGLAYDGTHVWVSSPYDANIVTRIDSSNPANQVKFAVCDEPGALLYTRAVKGVWVACQADGLIQKLSANPELSGLSTLESASLPPVTLGDDARCVYLPVIMKEAAPAPAGAEPGQTPGVTGAPVPVTPTATMTPMLMPILIPTPTAATP